MGIFKQNKPKKKKVLVKNLEIYKVFTPPTGYATADKAFNAFLCDNIWHFEAKIAKKTFFLVKDLEISKVFTPPTGYATAEEGFIAFLCDNIWAF